jgi:hypothetical protein
MLPYSIIGQILFDINGKCVCFPHFCATAADFGIQRFQGASLLKLTRNPTKPSFCANKTPESSNRSPGDVPCEKQRRKHPVSLLVEKPENNSFSPAQQPKAGVALITGKVLVDIGAKLLKQRMPRIDLQDADRSRQEQMPYGQEFELGVIGRK